MMRLLALALAASLLPCAASAQIVTSTVKIPDSNDDGVIKLDAYAARVKPAVKRGTTVIVCGSHDGLYRYAVKGTACPTIKVVTPPIVTPPVETPPVVVPPVTPPALDPAPPAGDVIAKLLPEGGAAIRNSRFNAAWNADGNLGTTKNLGAPFDTDAKNGFLRLTMYTGKGDDILGFGRSQDIAGLIVNGRTYAAGLLAGYRQMMGRFIDPFTFVGETVDTTKKVSPPPPDGIKFIQTVAIDGTVLSYRVRITNARAVPVSITYFRAEDPDSKASFATANRVTRAGRWEAGLTTGETYFIDSPDAGVYAATATYDKATTIGARREVGYSCKVDLTLQLVWPAKLLAPGESVDLAFRQGVK